MAREAKEELDAPGVHVDAKRTISSLSMAVQ